MRLIPGLDRDGVTAFVFGRRRLRRAAAKLRPLPCLGIVVLLFAIVLCLPAS